MQDAGRTEETFELVPLASGVNSLRSSANGQTFHPVVGPQREAEIVHVAGTRLVERANAFESGKAGEGFTLWDVGLGAAANALAAVAALAAGYRGNENVFLQSFDHSMGAFDFALANRAALVYPGPFAGKMEDLREDGSVGCDLPLSDRGAVVCWSTLLGDFPTVLSSDRELPAPHAVFYDPYSPTVNPEMWTLEVFAALLGRTRADTPCLLTTYTRSTAVRVTLLLAGWYVGVGGATGEKDETTVAANIAGLVERPLSRAWLEKKVYASTNAAPLRAGSEGTRRPISEPDFERLRGHPQMAGEEASGGGSAGGGPKADVR